MLNVKDRTMQTDNRREKLERIKQKAFGKEPSLSGFVGPKDIQLTQWLNYHAQTTDIEDNIEYMERFLVNKKYKNVQGILNSKMLTNHMCYMAKLLEVHFVSEEFEERLVNKINKIYAPKTEFKEKIRKAPKNKVFEDFESEILDCATNKIEVPGTYEWLVSKNARPNNVAVILDYVKNIYEKEISLIDKDEDLVYAYRTWSKKDIKTLQQTYGDIISDLEQYITGKKKQRKPRKTRAPKIRLDKVKYQKECTDLKVVSIDPKLIVGAKNVWTYNTKYNTLVHYKSEQGFSIKGTSITGFDSDSTSKRVGRKASEIIKTISGGGKVELRKVMDSIKGAACKPTGRLNEQTLIIRAF